MKILLNELNDKSKLEVHCDSNRNAASTNLNPNPNLPNLNPNPNPNPNLNVNLLNTPPTSQSPPVDGRVLLDDLACLLRRFVVLPQWAPETLALWTLHTYAFNLRDVTAYIGIESPKKRC